MALPAPRLDDRRFQELVDDAKRYVMRRCPEWTDHNVSDPGVTLIETFAFMTEQLMYRLNRVPDRLYLRFLDLIGLRMLPPTPAQAPITFWLSAAAVNPITVPALTNVASMGTETQDPIVFSTVEELPLIPCSVRVLMTGSVATDVAEEGGSGAERVSAPVDQTQQLRHGTPFTAFSARPRPGDVLLIGLDEPVPRCAVSLDFVCHIDGVGVDPANPPLVWEAWTEEGWTACDLARDETGGLNRDGSVVVLVPAGHAASVIEGERAGWLRSRVVTAESGQPAYTSAPIIHGLSAGTIGGTADAIHAEIIRNEILGDAEGVPGQRFTISRVPVLAGALAPVLEVSTEDGWEEWNLVESFGESGPHDRHFVLDAVTGEVRLGPAVREPDGGLRQFGMVPTRDCVVRLRSYATGGGMAGNLAKGAIRILKSSVPFVAAVENLKPAHGGADGETLEEAKARGPILLRTRGRAVTSEDYEEITREAAPEIARVRCLTAGDDGVDAGSVKILVVPACASVNGRIDFADLVPEENTLRRIADRLEQVRLIGARVLVEPPRYRGLTVVARLVARPKASIERVREDALTALYTYVNPVVGGPDGRGWPFGRPVQTGDIFGVLQQVRGVEIVEDVRLFAANPVTGQRGAETRRLDVEQASLAFSFDHQVRVEQN
jgi:predicted phage baseplate assembly protein